MQRRREGDGLVVRQGGRFVILDADELDQVLAFVSNAPELGRIERFKAPDIDSPVAPMRGVMAAPEDELNFVE